MRCWVQTYRQACTAHPPTPHTHTRRYQLIPFETALHSKDVSKCNVLRRQINCVIIVRAVVGVVGSHYTYIIYIYVDVAATCLYASASSTLSRLRRIRRCLLCVRNFVCSFAIRARKLYNKIHLKARNKTINATSESGVHTICLLLNRHLCICTHFTSKLNKKLLPMSLRLTEQR